MWRAASPQNHPKRRTKRTRLPLLCDAFKPNQSKSKTQFQSKLQNPIAFSRISIFFTALNPSLTNNFSWGVRVLAFYSEIRCIYFGVAVICLDFKAEGRGFESHQPELTKKIMNFKPTAQNSITEQHCRTALQNSITEQHYRTALQNSITEQQYRTALQNSII